MYENDMGCFFLVYSPDGIGNNPNILSSPPPFHPSSSCAHIISAYRQEFRRVVGWTPVVLITQLVIHSAFSQLPPRKTIID